MKLTERLERMGIFRWRHGHRPAGARQKPVNCRNVEPVHPDEIIALNRSYARPAVMW